MAEKPKRKNMVRFRLDEISVVDKPAQEGAIAVIMKRAGDVSLTNRIVDHFLATGGFAEDTHGKIAKKLGVGKAESSWPYFAALETSLQSIIQDGSLNDDDKVEMMKSSADDFLKTTSLKLPNVESYLLDGLSSADEVREMNLRQLKKQMDELGRKLEGFSAQVQLNAHKNGKLTRKADVTGEDEGGTAEDEEAAAQRLRSLLSGDKRAADDPYSVEPMVTEKEGDNPFMEEEDEEEVFEEEETEKGEDPENEKPTSEGEEEEPIAAGSASPIGGKRATIKRVYLNNDVIKVAGRTIHKSDIGGDLFSIIKAQQAQVDELAKRAEDERHAREMLEFTKVAGDNLGHLPGTPEQKARVLKAVSGVLGKEDRVVLSKMLRAGDGALSAAFRTVGHRYDKAGGSSDFNKRVAEIHSRDGGSRVEAMQKARREFPEEFDAYQGN